MPCGLTLDTPLRSETRQSGSWDASYDGQAPYDVHLWFNICCIIPFPCTYLSNIEAVFDPIYDLNTLITKYTARAC